MQRYRIASTLATIKMKISPNSIPLLNCKIFSQKKRKYNYELKRTTLLYENFLIRLSKIPEIRREPNFIKLMTMFWTAPSFYEHSKIDYNILTNDQMVNHSHKITVSNK
ncbi:hypothetical protein MXB_2267 [Myxobolus squamalis]|nr:hypothetical protein MXB_2267 [Myxobolus squamalis]